MKRKNRKKLMRLTAILLAVIICLDASTLYGIGWLASNITAYAGELVDDVMSKLDEFGNVGNSSSNNDNPVTEEETTKKEEIIDITPIAPENLPQFLGATVTPNAAKVAEIVAKIQNRASTMTKQQLAGIDGSYYVFAITTPEELMAVQVASETDTLADCAFTLAKSKDEPDNEISKNANLSGVVGFTGISPNPDYPFSGVFGAYIDNVNYTISCPLFTNLSTDATVHNLSLYSVQSANAVAAIAKNLVKGEDESLKMDNIHIKGAFGSAGNTNSIAVFFANVINHKDEKLVVNFDDFNKIYLEPNTITGTNQLPAIQANAATGGLIGYAEGNVEIVIGNSLLTDKIIINAGPQSYVGRYIGYAKDGVVIRVVSDDVSVKIGSVNGKYVGGIVGRVEGNDDAECEIVVEDTAKLTLVTGGVTGSTNVAEITGGFAGYVTKTKLDIKNITSVSGSIHANSSGRAGVLFGKISESNNGKFENITIKAATSGAIALVSYINGGVIGELMGDNHTFNNINILGDIYLGNAENQITGGIVGRVAGTNIVLNDILIEVRAQNLGNFRGIYRGGIFGEIFHIVSDDYNSIKINNYTATGLNGAVNGGFGNANANICQGAVAGKVCDRTLLCLDGTIDLSKFTFTGNSFDYLNCGLIIGSQEDALIYAEKDAVIIRRELDTGAIDGVEGRIPPWDDIGTSGGIYINREINAEGDLLIDFNKSKDEIKNCVNGEVATDATGAYVFKDEADFMRMSIFMYTLNKFAANCFPGIERATLLASDIKVEADTIDLRGTGVYCLMQNGTALNQAVETYAYSGTMSGVDAKTTIILENVLSAQFNLGLFTCVNNATFRNLAIISGTNPEDTGYIYARNFGAIAPVAYNNLTLENVDIGTKVAVFAGNNDIDTYAGGAIGYYNMKGGKLVVSDCNFYPTITEIGYRTYAGGLVGRILANSTTKTSESPYDITIKNVTIGTKLYTRTNYFPNDNALPGKFAGLIANINDDRNIASATYTKIALQNIIVDGFVLDMSKPTYFNGSPYTYTGGMLGSLWNGVDVVISKNAVDNTNTDDISLFAKSADIDLRLRIGGLVSTVCGKILFKDVVIGEKGTVGKISINNIRGLSHMGMLVNEGLNAYVLVDNYQLNAKNDDGTRIIEVISSQPIDDIIGYNLNTVNGTVGGIVNIKDEGFKNGTSQGYVNKLVDNVYHSNDWVRYYYNLFEFDEAYANNKLGYVIDNAYRLMIYELYHYTNNTLDRFVYEYIEDLNGNGKQDDFLNSYNVTGTIELKGHSFYPIQLNGGTWSFVGNNATIIFPDEEYIAMFVENSMQVNTRRHYRLWSGLFTGGFNINISGITFKGVVADTVNGSFLTWGNVNGSANISNITFDGAYIYKYDKQHYVGLMIRYISDHSNFNISGIRMINYNTGSVDDKWIDKKVAGALIGVVGSAGAVNIKITLRDIKLDYLVDKEEAGKATGLSDKISPFRYATMICAYDYTNNRQNNQCYGVYYFTSDDYLAGNVTVGRELKDKVEFMDDKNATNASAYAELTNISALVNNSQSKYLPYVCTVNTSPTIFVNPKNGNLLEGCGTYSDPYIISNVRQLYSLYMYLAKNQSYNQILNGWKVNGIGNQTSDAMCDSVLTGTDHIYYTYDGYNLANNADFPTKSELANAYYLITADIDMSVIYDINSKNLGYEFVGLGNADLPFTGVIVGRKPDGSEPTIILPGSNGNHYKLNSAFIQYMNGGVVKDLIIKTAYGEGEGQSLTADKLVISSGSAILISKVLGGDNIIDNVKIDGTIFISNTANDSIGGYVNTLEKGGIIFRNITAGHMSGFVVESAFTNVALNNKNYAYLVYSVKDGYMLYEDTSGTPFMEDVPVILKEHLDNPGLDTDNLDRYELTPMFNMVNVSYLDSSADKISVSKTDNNIEIILSNDKHLQILAMALNSDALSVSGTNLAASIADNGYDRTSSTRKALYNALGMTGTDCTNAVTYDNNGYKYPYLIYKYFELPAGDSLDNYYSTYVHTNGVEYIVSQFNKTATMEGIQNFVTEHNTTYKITNGAFCDMSVYGYSFRGIGAQYYMKYSRFNGSFDGANATAGGDNATIKLGMTNDYDVSRLNVALFNEINTSAYVAGNLTQGQKDETAPYIKNITVTGSVINNNTFEGTSAFGATDAPRAAAIVSALYGSYIFENISLKGVNVTAKGDTGGIIGRIMNQNVAKWYSVILRNCSVIADGGVNSHIASVRLANDNPHWENLFDAGGLIGKVGSNTYYLNDAQLASTVPIFQGYISIEDCKVDGLDIEANRGSVGGFIGAVRYINKTTVDIFGSTDNTSYLKNLDVNISANNSAANGAQHNGSAGGVIGEYFPVRRLQGNTDANRRDNTLNINNIDVETVDISASDMTDRDMYNETDSIGQYGLGGIVGIIASKYYNLNNSVSITGCDVSDIRISDTSTGTFANGNSGGIIGAAGLIRKRDKKEYAYIDNLTLTDCTVSNLTIEATGVKNWAHGSIAGQISARNVVIKNIAVANTHIDGVSNVAGGLVGCISKVPVDVLVRDITVENSELYSSHNNINNDRVYTLSGVTGGVFATAIGGSYNFNIYNVDVRNTKMVGHYTGGFMGTAFTNGIKFTVHKFTLEESKLLGRLTGGLFGTTYNNTIQQYSYYNDIDIIGNIIYGYSPNATYASYIGGIIGYSDYLSGYFSDLYLEDNVIAANQLFANKIGGIYGGIYQGPILIYEPILKNNNIGFVNGITSYEKTMFIETDGKDAFDNIDYTTEVMLLNTKNGSYVFEQISDIAEQNELLYFSLGTGVMVGTVNVTANLSILAPSIIYDDTFTGSRPVVDVGLMNRIQSLSSLNRPSTTEMSAVLKYSDPTVTKKFVVITYSKNAAGDEIKTYPDASIGIDIGTYYPTKLEEFADPTTAFGSLSTILSKYQNVLDKEEAGTLTLEDVLGAYRLNIAYQGCINPGYVTIRQLINESISYKKLSDTVINMDGIDVPIIVADGQYTSAESLIYAVTDAMTNVGALGANGTKIESRKAKLTIDSNGDCVINYISGTPTISINGNSISYRDFDTFGEEGGVNYATISVVKITCGWQSNGANYCYTKTVDASDADNTTFSVNAVRCFYIPVFVKERLQVNESFVICEGAVYDTESIEEKGYSGSVVMAKDTTYTILSEFHYGKSIAKDNYGSLYMEKKIVLANEDGSARSMDEGTLLTMIEVNTGKAYYYRVTGNETSGIKYTDFKDIDGNNYVNRNMKWFNDNGLVKTDASGELYGEEKFIIVVDLPEDSVNAEYTINISSEDTDDRLMQIEPSKPINIEAIPGLNISFDNKKYSDDDSDEDKTYIQGELTNTKKDSITIDMLTAIEAAVDPITGFAGYWNYASGDNIIDSANNGKFIELAIYLQVQGATKRMSLPVGTKAVIFDDANPSGKEIDIAYGQSVIYYYKNSENTYALDSISEDTYRAHKVVLDFSDTDLKDYTDSNYEIYVELIRTADPNYPMSSDKRDEYSRPVATAVTRDFAIATEVKDLLTLGINTYRQNEYIYDIPFISKIDFSDMIDFVNSSADNIDIMANLYSEKNYYISYRLYRKEKTSTGHEYVQIDDEHIKLYKEEKDGSGNIVTTEYEKKIINGKLVYVDTYNFTAEEIKNGTDNGVTTPVYGLVMRDMKLVVNTEGISDEDLSNYKLEMRLVPYDKGINEDDVTDETLAISDYFIFTIAKLKTDM